MFDPSLIPDSSSFHQNSIKGLIGFPEKSPDDSCLIPGVVAQERQFKQECGPLILHNWQLKKPHQSYLSVVTHQ